MLPSQKHQFSFQRLQENEKENIIHPPKIGFNCFTLLLVGKIVLTLSIVNLAMNLMVKLEEPMEESQKMSVFWMFIYFLGDTLCSLIVYCKALKNIKLALMKIIGLICARVFTLVVTSFGFFVPLYVIAAIACVIIDALLFSMIRDFGKRKEQMEREKMRKRIKYMTRKIAKRCGKDTASEEMAVKILKGDFVEMELLIDKVSLDAIPLIEDRATIKGGVRYIKERQTLKYYVQYDEHLKIESIREDSQIECIRLNGQYDLLEELQRDLKYFYFLPFLNDVCVDVYTKPDPFDTNLFNSELYVKLKDFAKLAKQTKEIVDRKDVLLEENTRLLDEIRKMIIDFHGKEVKDDNSL